MWRVMPFLPNNKQVLLAPGLYVSLCHCCWWDFVRRGVQKESWDSVAVKYPFSFTIVKCYRFGKHTQVESKWAVDEDADNGNTAGRVCDTLTHMIHVGRTVHNNPCHSLADIKETGWILLEGKLKLCVDEGADGEAMYHNWFGSQDIIFLSGHTRYPSALNPISICRIFKVSHVHSRYRIIQTNCVNTITF